MKRKVIMALMLTICFSMSALAAPVTVAYDDLEKLINQNSPAVKSARETLTKAKEKAYSYDDPAINIYNSKTQVQLNYEKELQEAKNSGMSQQLLDAIRVNYEAQMTQLDSTLSQLDSSNQQNADSILNAEKSLKKSIDAQVSQAQNQFVTAYSIDAEISASNINLKTYKEQLERAKLLVKYGRLAETELEAYKKKVTDEEQALVDANNRKQQNLIQLKATLGLVLSGDIALGKLPEFDLSVIDKISFDSDKSAMFAANEDIRKAQSDYDNLKKGYTLDRDISLTEAKNTLDKARSDAELSFMTSYNDLIKSYNSYKSSLASLTDERTKLTRLELQYKYGKVSQASVQEQKDAISRLEHTLESTKLSVFLKLQSYTQVKLDKAG